VFNFWNQFCYNQVKEFHLVAVLPDGEPPDEEGICSLERHTVVGF
jgi:hypothetical protein